MEIRTTSRPPDIIMISTPVQPQELLYSAMMLAARDRLSAAPPPSPGGISDAPVVVAAGASNVAAGVCSRLNLLMSVSYDRPECVRGKVMHLLHGVRQECHVVRLRAGGGASRR